MSPVRKPWFQSVRQRIDPFEMGEGAVPLERPFFCASDDWLIRVAHRTEMEHKVNI